MGLTAGDIHTQTVESRAVSAWAESPIKYLGEKWATREMVVFLYRKFLDPQEGWSKESQLMARGSE